MSVKRLLDCTPSDLARYTKAELLDAIAGSEGRVTISQSLMHHGSDYTPWEGYEVTGWPQATILRGEVVMQEGEILGSKQGGRFLPRALSPMAARGAGAPLG